MLVSNQLYQSVGGYDETFQFQAEEFDWQARAQKMGFRVMYTPAAKLWHKDSMTIGKQSSFKAYFDARNPMLVILKHKTADYFRRYFWHHFVINVFRRSLVSIKKGRILHALKIWQGFLSGLIWGFKTGRFTMRHFVGAV
jgi:GT2 family glycosyltransferase